MSLRLGMKPVGRYLMKRSILGELSRARIVAGPGGLLSARFCISATAASRSSFAVSVLAAEEGEDVRVGKGRNGWFDDLGHLRQQGGINKLGAGFLYKCLQAFRRVPRQGQRVAARM